LLGLLGLNLVVSGPIITTILAALRGQRKASEAHDEMSERVGGIENQVVNHHGHEPPVLRDDVDRVIRTSEQTYELLLDTHKLVTNHHTHIQDISDKYDLHSRKINEIHADVHKLTRRVDDIEKY
jgi:hypothetical protein